MTQFLAFGLIICLAMGFWLSNNPWGKMLAILPLGMLVPAFYGTAVNCGLGFVTEFFGAGQCQGGNTPRQVFAGMYVLSFVPVVIFAVLSKIGRVIWAGRGA